MLLPLLMVEPGAVLPLLRVLFDVAPLFWLWEEDPLFSEEPVEAPLVVDEPLSIDPPVVDCAPPDTLAPPAPEPRLPPPVVPAPPPAPVDPPEEPPDAPPEPPAPPLSASKKSLPGEAALTPETGSAIRAMPASKE